MMSAAADTQVTAIVQQIEAQGPAIVQRVTTQFADVACTAENARKLIDALHNGTSVTLTADGKTATFTPTSKLGYGEAYIAMALAAEALRNAGVSGCATPDQWQAALMGGPLAATGATSTTATASSTSRFPGILTLHSQGQGWGQIAQTANVQLGQIVSKARTSLNLGSAGDALSPTGRSSAEMQRSRSGTTSSSSESSTYPSSSRSRQDDATTSPGTRSSTTPPSTSPGSSSSSSSPYDPSSKSSTSPDSSSSAYPSSSTSPSTSPSSSSSYPSPSSSTTPSSSSSSPDDSSSSSTTRGSSSSTSRDDDDSSSSTRSNR